MIPVHSQLIPPQADCGPDVFRQAHGLGTASRFETRRAGAFSGPAMEGSVMIPQVSIPAGQSGNWRVEHFEVPERSIESMRLAMHGRPIRPGRYTKLLHGHYLVMSDTPAEMRDHYDFVWKAKGHCLINGLGLGMCLGAALLKPEVTRVTVVEKSADVITLVGSAYTDPRVEIIHADAFEYQPPKGIRYGAVWHDIWNDICTDNLPEMQRLHRKYGRRTDWQGSWCRWQCERGR